MEIHEALKDPLNWKPNLKRLAEQTGLPYTTVAHQVQRRLEKKTISLTVNEHTESESEKIKNEERNN